jgi:hypothetical protein
MREHFNPYNFIQKEARESKVQTHEHYSKHCLGSAFGVESHRGINFSNTSIRVVVTIDRVNASGSMDGKRLEGCMSHCLSPPPPHTHTHSHTLLAARCYDVRSYLPNFPKTTRFNPLTPELNPSMQRCLTRFLLGILLLELCISLIYAWKPNKYTNYSFSLLIMYCRSYVFRHYIAILRERS